MSGPLRVLALTTARTPTADFVRRQLAQLQVGGPVHVEVLTVFAPREPLDTHRVDTVDPSLVPYRPVIPISGPGLVDWGGPRKFTARALRAARGISRRVRPGAGAVDPIRALEVACATSPALARRADGVDVVLALDDGAVPGAARLGQRAPRPVVIRGAKHVRRALELRGYTLPPVIATGSGATPESMPKAPATSALPPAPADEPVRVLIAPANYAGQAARWAGAIRAHVPQATAINAQMGAHPRFPFPTDYDIDREVFSGNLEWRIAWREFVHNHFTHVIAEVNRPLLGRGSGDGQLDVTTLRRAGKTVALLAHGSDARIPSVHVAREPWHSYGALDRDTLDGLERSARRNTEIYNRYDGTVFVSTPGLFAFIPGATWLPLVIDVDQWHTDASPFERKLVRVAHIPSSAQKGSHMIDPVLSSMHERGVIEYVRAESIPHSQMPSFYGSADIVVEQIGTADYGTAACEALACGRVVVGRVADETRIRVQAESGLELPIVEANPSTLEQVILDLVGDRAGARSIADSGPRFCLALHDGRRSAAVLQEWIAGTANA